MEWLSAFNSVAEDAILLFERTLVTSSVGQALCKEEPFTERREFHLRLVVTVALVTSAILKPNRQSRLCREPDTARDMTLKTQVWDLRTFRLLRSVPHLSGASLAFNSCGDIAYATLRRPEAGSWSGYSSHRSKRHPLFTAFATVGPLFLLC